MAHSRILVNHVVIFYKMLSAFLCFLFTLWFVRLTMSFMRSQFMLRKKDYNRIRNESCNGHLFHARVDKKFCLLHHNCYQESFVFCHRNKVDNARNWTNQLNISLFCSCDRAHGKKSIKACKKNQSHKCIFYKNQRFVFIVLYLSWKLKHVIRMIMFLCLYYNT